MKRIVLLPLIFLVLTLSGCSSFKSEYRKCKDNTNKIFYCYINSALWTPAVEAGKAKGEIESK